MNKLFVMLLILAGMMTACGGNSQKNAADTEDTATSLSDTIPTEDEEIITDAILFNAKGNIWRIVERYKEDVYEMEDVYEFDMEGHIKSIEGLDNIKIERDEKGRPVEMKYTILDDIEEPQQSSITYEYNDLNQLVKENQKFYDGDWIVEYAYDEEGRQISKHSYSNVENTPAMTYTYPEDAFDANGNWIIRMQENPKATITRTITYRE